MAARLPAGDISVLVYANRFVSAVFDAVWRAVHCISSALGVLPTNASEVGLGSVPHWCRSALACNRRLWVSEHSGGHAGVCDVLLRFHSLSQAEV